MTTPSFEIVNSDGNGNIWIKPSRLPVNLTYSLVIDKDGVIESEYIEESSC